MKKKEIIKIEQVEGKILMLRGVRVILDADVAALYDVETKEINQAVKNNLEKFPERFSWILNDEESNFLQTSKNNDIITEINFNDNDNTMDQYIQYLYNYEEEIKKDCLDLQNKYELKIDDIQNEINILIQEIDELSK